jgi:hypothetical protein
MIRFLAPAILTAALLVPATAHADVPPTPIGPTGDMQMMQAQMNLTFLALQEQLQCHELDTSRVSYANDAAAR